MLKLFRIFARPKNVATITSALKSMVASLQDHASTKAAEADAHDAAASQALAAKSAALAESANAAAVAGKIDTLITA